MVDGIEGMGGAAAPGGHHGCTDLAPEGATVGQGHEARPVDEGLQVTGHIRKVGGRAQHNGIRLPHLLEDSVELVLAVGAVVVPLLPALAAGQAAVEVSAADLHEFRVPTSQGERSQHRFQQKLGVAVLPGTSVEG